MHELGRHFILGLSSTELTQEEKLGLSILRPAGIIVFQKTLMNLQMIGVKS